MTRRFSFWTHLLLLPFLLAAAPLVAQTSRQAPGQQAKDNKQAPGQYSSDGWVDTQAVRPVGPEGRAVVPVAPQPNYRPNNMAPQIWTDRPQYTVGDRMRILFRVSEDANVYIFNTDGAGRRTQIFPNWFDQQNRVRAGRTYQIPDGSYDLQIQPPAGNETLTILAVSEEYPELRRHYHSYSQSAPFSAVTYSPEDFVREMDSQGVNASVSGGGKFETPGNSQGANNRSQRAVVVVPPQPSYPPAPGPQPPMVRYGMTTMSLRTFDPYQAPERPPVYPIPAPVGWLRVSTRPSSADVFVNGAFSGRTPTRLELPVGTHNIELRRNGFTTEYRRISIAPGQSSNMSLALQPEYRIGYDVNFGYSDGSFQFQGGVNRND